MLQNYDVDIQNFIKFTSSGVEVASFVQIRDALINKYKDVYGDDIDLSTGTADGVFINNIALMINNILQSFKTFYSNLDVNSASGIYLDNLCSLANIQRKPATKSNVSIQVTNLDTVNSYSNGTPDNYEEITFIDKAGTEWIYDGYLQLSSYGNAGDSKSITVECSEKGSIQAPGDSVNGDGWIYQTLEVSNLSVKQYNDANVGEDIESDNELRARRAQSSGADGTTVLDSLVGSLLEISGIRDVRIYNNTSESPGSAKDSTSIPLHNTYVIVRYNEGVEVDDNIIGKLIYEKMTPGIQTTETDDSTYGQSKSYNYIPEADTSLTLFSSIVYWKKAIPVHPTITVVLKTFDYFTTDEVPIIGNELIKYLNSLQLSQNLTEQNILIQTSYADPLFLNKTTYTVGSISITGAVSGTYSNPDTYYNYTTVSSPDTSVSGQVTFTIS